MEEISGSEEIEILSKHEVRSAKISNLYTSVNSKCDSLSFFVTILVT